MNDSRMNILVGDWSKNVVELSLANSLSAIAKGVELRYSYFRKESDIKAAATSGEFDIAILVLNNIAVDPIKTGQEKNDIERRLQLITFLAKTAMLPVSVLYGYPRDPQFADQILAAGASSATQVPFPVADLTQSILRMIRNILPDCDIEV